MNFFKQNPQGITSNYGTLKALAVVLMLSSLSFQTLAREPKKDKSELYKRFPQLISNETDECVKGMNRMMTNFFEYPYDQMMFYSLHAINELGYHEQCQRDLGEYADFVVMNSNVSHLSGYSRMGLCLPKECKQHHYDAYSAVMLNLVNGFFAALPNYGIILGGSIFRPWTRVGMSMTKSEEYQEDYHARTYSGFIPTLIIICSLISLALFATFYTYLKMKNYNTNILESMVVSNELDDRLSFPLHLSQEQRSLLDFSNNIKDQNTQMNSQLRDSSSRSPINVNNNIFSITQQQDSGNSQNMALNYSSNQQTTIRNDNSQILITKSIDYSAQVQKEPLSKILGLNEEDSKYYKNLKANETLVKLSAQCAIKDLQDGYCKEWDNKELDVINAMKFFQQFLIIVTCTASYLILGACLNPWSMQVFSSNPMFSMIVAGVIALDVYFTFSAFFGFYRICQAYDAQKGLSFKDVMKIYAKRLVRLLPIYYLTLLFGIFVGPRISSGPLWYMYEQSLFFQCDKYWWTNVLLVANFVPWDQDNKSGCMPWSWQICADFQLFLFIPLYVWAYKQSKTAGLIIGWSFIIVGMSIVAFFSVTGEYTANVYSLENYTMYQLLTTKPWGKFHLHGLGILAAILYFDVLAYRKLENFERAKKFPKIHFLSSNVKVAKISMLIGVTLIVTNFFVTFKPGQDAYLWSTAANTTYLVLSKISFALGWLILAFYIFLGHSKMGRNALGNPFMNLLGKQVYLAYLTAPIIMMIVYSNDERGVFMTFVGNSYLGIGHLLITFILGFVIYIFLEFQLKRLCEIYIVEPYLSHDHIIRKAYLQQQNLEVIVEGSMKNGIESCESVCKLKEKIIKKFI